MDCGRLLFSTAFHVLCARNNTLALPLLLLPSKRINPNVNIRCRYLAMGAGRGPWAGSVVGGVGCCRRTHEHEKGKGNL